MSCNVVAPESMRLDELEIRTEDSAVARVAAVIQTSTISIRFALLNVHNVESAITRIKCLWY